MRRITSSWDLQQQQGLAVTILLRQGKTAESIERADLLVDEARRSGSSRALVLATTSRALVGIHLGDRECVAAMVAETNELVADWPRVPLQLSALIDLARAGLSMLDDDLDQAEAHLRKAADDSVASHDHPIMSMVAINVGLLALERGDAAAAARALDLAVSLRGTPDPLDAGERKLRAALEARSPAPALEGAGAGLDRKVAASELAQILRR
jgi:hypothetical protein